MESVKAVTDFGIVDAVNGSRNASNGSIVSGEPMSTTEAVTYSLVLSALIATTIVGNVLVVISVFTYAPLKTTPNFFVASLAGADLAVAVLVMPFNVANFVQGRWTFGVVWCNAWLTLDILACTASILHLCAIALDRYRAIHDPITYALQRTRRRVLAKIAIVWATSAVISVPPLIGWNSGGRHSLYDAESGQCQLTDDRGFVVYSAAGSFYIPLAIMTVVYARIFQATRARLRARAAAAAGATCLRPTSTAVQALTVATATTAGDENGTTAAATDVVETRAASPEEDQDGDEQHAGALSASTSMFLRAPAAGAYDDAVSTCGEVDTTPVDGTPVLDRRSPAIAAAAKKARRKRQQKRANGSTRDGASGTPVNRQLYEFMEEKQRISLTKERRAARTMAIIMGAFVVCWLPFFLMYVIFPFCAYCAAAVDPRVVNFIVWLGYINSALNPVIYTVFNVDFRRAFQNILTANCRRR